LDIFISMNFRNPHPQSPAIRESVFKSFPVLETGRLILREINPGDANLLFNYYSNAQVMQYRGAPCYQSVSEAYELITDFANQYKARTGLRWGIAFKEKPMELLGTAGLKNIHSQHLRGELGYELNPGFWNRGLMTEALRKLTAFCFSDLQLHSIEANIAPDNTASERVLQKLGFVKEAHFKENWYYQGWWDSVIYSLHAPV
jgi:ribosomal-protein-alanine N-acetyltransferase